MKKIIASITLLFSFFLMSNFAYAVNVNTDVNVTICHKNQGVNGWSSITVSSDSIDGLGNGNADHNQNGHQDGLDIIPPGLWDLDGRNWDVTGQAIWANGCSAVTSTPTPTVTQSVPTVTPTPTMGNECDLECQCDGYCYPTITITNTEECPDWANNCEIGNINLTPTQGCCTTPTPTVTPAPTSTTAPTNTPSSSNGGTGGGSSSTNSTSASTSNPSTGNVLGATTLPATGTFMNSFMNAVLIAGVALFALSQKKYASKKA